MIVNIEKLSKKFGKKNALEDINLQINDGMYGLLGPNGAGKTTLIRILTTLVKKSSGMIRINGIDIENTNEIRRIIGYLPQEFSFFPSLTVYEMMDYFALLSDIKPSTVRKKLIYELLEKVNLQENMNKKTKTLSGGMKRRLGIAQALINNPQLLIVDEPTAGLDPEERIRFRNVLSNFATGRSVILSTHIASDIEYACEKLAILKQGRLIYDGKVSEIIEQANNNVWILNVERNEWEKNRGKFGINDAQVLSSVIEGDMIRLRILAAEKPMDYAEATHPMIEDAYMKFIKEV